MLLLKKEADFKDFFRDWRKIVKERPFDKYINVDHQLNRKKITSSHQKVDNSYLSLLKPQEIV